MKPTKEELAEKYNEYNELYLNGEMEKLTTKNFFFISKKVLILGDTDIRP